MTIFTSIDKDRMKSNPFQHPTAGLGKRSPSIAAMFACALAAPFTSMTALANTVDEAAQAQAWFEKAFGVETPHASASPALETHRPIGLGKSILGEKLKIGEVYFYHGIGSRSVSELLVHSSSGITKFTAKVGIDNNQDMQGKRGSVVFVVESAGKELYRSPLCKGGDAPLLVAVDVPNAKELVLRVLDGVDGNANDPADWAEAKIETGEGNAIWLDQLPSWKASGIPFSFLYGGVPSSSLLPGWETKLESEKTIDGKKRRILTYTDPTTRMEIRCEATWFVASSAVEWVLYATNKGTSDSAVLEELLPMNLHLDIPNGDVTLHCMHGSEAGNTDFQPVDAKLPDPPERWWGQMDIAPTGGRSSQVWMPYFNLEHAEGGVVGAIGWSGQWAFHTRRDDRQVLLQASQQTFRAKLHPGETIRTSRMLLVFWKGSDPIRGNNLFRRLLVKHYVPRINDEVALPPTALMTWFTHGEGNGVTEENQKAAIQAAANAGCEAFWIDAGWFEGGWPSGAGNWVCKPESFPNGLKPLGDEAHRRGMKFVLWFEPERVSATSRIAKEHPEWVLHRSDNPKEDGLFNLGDPAARSWMSDHLSKCIAQWGIDILRIDFNIDPLSFWQRMDVADRQGITEMRYIEGLYAMWDDLKARHPGLLIDNCASGGRRLDIEMQSRSYPLWQSDSQGSRSPQPAIDQAQNAGLSLYLPLHSGGVWAFDPYNFRSMATTGLVICPDITKDETNMPLVQKMLEETKSLRPLALGDFYPLTRINADEQTWCAWQYDRPDLGTGYVMAFRRSKSPFVSAQFPLRGLEPDADYVLTNVDTQEQKTVVGSVLAHGLSVDLPEQTTTTLVTYKKVGQK